MVEEVSPKIDMVNGKPANYTVTAINVNDNSPLFINGMEQIVVEPTAKKIDYNLYIVGNKGDLLFTVAC